MRITSLYGAHIINCAGNGGWLGLDDKDKARKARLLRSWGRTSSIYSDINQSENLNNRLNVKIDDFYYDSKFVFEEFKIKKTKIF